MARQKFSSTRRAGGSVKVHALVVVGGGLGDAGHDQAGQRRGLLGPGLRVADADLDGAEGVVRAHAPPQLGVLDDGVGAHQEVDVVGPCLPAAERLRDAAAGKALGEDLRARRLQARVAAVQEHRVGRQGQQLGQDRPQAVAHGDGAVGAADPHVHVQAEGVVAPGHVLQPVLDPVVVVRVDHRLVLPRAPRVRGRGRQQRALARGQGEQAGAVLALAGQRVGQVGAAAGGDLDLGLDQLAGHRLGQHRVRPGRRRAAPRTAAPGPASAGSRMPNSSSMPTVKSSEASKTSRARVMSSMVRPGRSRARTAGPLRARRRAR